MNTENAEGHVQDTVRRYRGYSRKRVLFLVGLVLITFAISIVTIGLGSTDLTYGDIFRILLGGRDGTWDSYVVWDLRIPIILAAILVGAGLGVAGAVMQGILRNPLASPYTLGISNASAFGASVGILLLSGGLTMGWFSSSGIQGQLVVVVFAFIFAMIATGIVVVLVKFTSTSPETIVLAGLAISAIFSSGLAFLQYIADDVTLASMVFWQFGSLDKMGWNSIYIVLAVTVLALIYFVYKRFDYNVMEAGDEVASGLGIDISRTRIVGLTIAAILTAVVVSFAGIIGFIGLLAPHVVRRLIGNDNRYLLIGSVLVGAAVMLLANMISQHAFGMVIPIGIITSAVGGPLFLYILIRGHKKNASC